MRILHVDKFLRRSGGGAAGYMLDLARLQRRAGHQVEFFSMDHPDNEPATYQHHFAPFVRLEPAPEGRRDQLVAAGRMVHSFRAAAGMAAVLDRFEPDVVHLHNIYHQLSPSILRPIAKRHIPAVMTVHDYKLVCPTYRMLSHGSVCDACVEGSPFEATKRRCQGGSRAASAVLSIESALHRRFEAYGPIGRFIAPSRFLADTLRRGGVFPDRVHHIPNFVDTDALTPRQGPGTAIVSIGRLSVEKGVDTVIRAVGMVAGAELIVAGSGPERAALETLARSEAPGQVRFVGHLSADGVAELNRSARVAVLAARWHENMPLSVLETMGAGVPMVVTSLGGLPELVDHGTNGLIVPPDDPHALAEALAVFVEGPDRARLVEGPDRARHVEGPDRSMAMGAAARRKMIENHNAADHLDAVLAVYAEA